MDKEKTKEESLVEDFELYLKNNDTEAILSNLPKLLKGYIKNSKRMNKILKQGDAQQLKVLKLTEILEDTNHKVNALLNNAGQGFLYFDNNMHIGSEYSKEAYEIFQQDLVNKDITTLLYTDKEDQLFLKTTLQGILEDTPMRQEILISLLQQEFKINNRFINIEYKILSKTTFMLILTDITDKKELDQKIKNEQQILKMVVEVATTLEQFVEIKQNYKNFILNINEYKDVHKLSELSMHIHTFKGLFAQKEMLHIVNSLHQFEDEIALCKKQNIITDTITNITFDIMNSWLEQDIKILKSILGDDFISKENYISIDKNRIGKLYAKVQQYIQTANTDTKAQEILDNIEELKYNNIEILFRPYKKLIEQLSTRLNKEVYPLILNGKDIYISNIYKSFINSLVHIFRNSLDHGIESAEIRIENNKDQKGTITCDIVKTDTNIIISIKDDGAGINIQKVKNKAIEKQLFSKKQLDTMDEQQLLLLIFEENFSTSETITDISGRGIGISSVLYELNKLHGEIQIINNIGQGVEFIFTLPIYKYFNNHIDMLEKLSGRTISYFQEIYNISLSNSSHITYTDTLQSEVSVIIPLTNDMDGYVYMGVSKNFALQLISLYIEELNKEEIEELLYENIAEILNITLGNILKNLNIAQNGGAVGILVPEILQYNMAITKQNNSKIFQTKLYYKKDTILLGYFI